MMHSQVQLAQKSKKISNPFTRSLRLTEGMIPQAISHPAWGIDPGVNFGLTVIEEDRVFVFHGALLQDDKPGRYGLLAYKFLESISRTYRHHNAIMVIEGAAYGAPFRQVELSELRTGFYLAASLDSARFSDVVIKPPATIRKAVFDNGKVQAGDEWPTLNHNAADSLSMALYAASLPWGVETL